MSKPLGLFVDGSWRGSRGGREFSILPPATRKPLGHLTDATYEDACEAVQSAQKAFPAWAALPPADRGRLLLQLGERILAHQDELAGIVTLEQGKPFRESRAEIGQALDCLHWHAEEGRRSHGDFLPSPSPDVQFAGALKQPVGVVGCIVPWNVPSLWIVRKLSAAWAAGCTMVVAPAEQASLSAAEVFKLIGELEFPGGVANLVTTSDPEPVARAFLDRPEVRCIAFTGSAEAGRKLIRAAAAVPKRLFLELGGHAPLVVFDDAELEVAVRGALFRKFSISGQSCLAVNRLYIQKRLFDAFVEKFAAAARALRLGDGFLEASDVGPLMDDRVLERMSRQVEDALERGARLICGGQRNTRGDLAKGCYYEPTLLTGVTEEALAVRDETCGPVAPLLSFQDEEEVYRRANASADGMAAYVYTSDPNRGVRALKSLRYRYVALNEFRSGSSPEAPLRGVDGIGRPPGCDDLDEFLETKYISIR